jgi:hypothetical protein
MRALHTHRVGAWKIKEKDPDYVRRAPQAKQVMLTLQSKASEEDLIERAVIGAYLQTPPKEEKAGKDAPPVLSLPHS